MLAAETCFCELNNSPVRHIRGRVELYNGSALLDTFKHTDKLKSFTIERVGESGKFFGFGIIHKMNLKVLDEGRQLNITTANTLDAAFGVGCDFIYCYPLFNVSQVHRDETTNELSITAYDALYKAANYTVNDLGLPAAYTLNELAAACAAVLGVPLNITANGFDLYYPAGANFEGIETIKEVLDAIAEATQTIYYLNNNYALTFKRLDKSGTAVKAITKEHYFTLDSSTNRRLAAITHATELGDNITASLEVSGTTQFVRDNPLWDMREDAATLVNNALSNMGGISINQFVCDWRGNYLLEIGDKISLTTKDNNTVISYVLDDVITYDGSFAETTQWSYTDNDTETASNPTNLGDALKQTYAKVDKANKQIEIVASKTDANTNELAAIKLDTQNISISVGSLTEGVAANTSSIEANTNDIANVEATANANASNIAALVLDKESIKASVSNLETNTNNALSNINGDISTITSKVEAAMTADAVKLSIQEELANGVDKVYTSTGFSFDADGLRVSKTGSEMESLLDEDGLTVYRDNTEVLTADNTGVNGINMTVRQYLIVGGSRFEAYGAGRTGCFWVD